MATMNTPRHAHAAGRRADVYGVVLGYEAAEPWRYHGSTAHIPGHGYTPAKPRSRWTAALRRLLINLAGH
jgi:hypothetical protein